MVTIQVINLELLYVAQCIDESIRMHCAQSIP